MAPAKSGRSASGTVAWSASATYTARLAASSAKARGVYRSRTLDWLNASPKRSTMRMRSELLAIATKPSGHWSEQKPARQRQRFGQDILSCVVAEVLPQHDNLPCVHTMYKHMGQSPSSHAL